MRRSLRYTLVAASLAVAAFVPASGALAASATPGAGPGSAQCTGDQQRLQLHDGSGVLAQDRLQQRDQTRDQDRLQLRDGTCTADQQRLQLRDGTGGGFVRAGARGFVVSVHRATGPNVGVHVTDGTNCVWHWVR